MLPQQGQGIARQRQAIVNGLRDSVMVCSADPHAVLPWNYSASACLAFESTNYSLSDDVLSWGASSIGGVHMQDFEKGVSDVQSRDVIEMMMITQYFDMLKVSLPSAGCQATHEQPDGVLAAPCTAAALPSVPGHAHARS